MPALATLALLTAALPPQVRVVPQQAETQTAARDGVDVYLINEGGEAAEATPPATLDVTTRDDATLTLRPYDGAVRTIAAGGFAKLRYRSTVQMAASPIVRPIETLADSGNGTVASFADRFTPYQPIYGIAGVGDSGAKLQVSFAVQPFGGDGPLSRVRFAYTQTMFWAIDRPSGPFRSTNYSPELFVTQPVGGLDVALGYAHDSNGRGEIGSIDVNRVFLRARKDFALGNGWQAEVVPQAWFYVGKQGVAPNLEEYWGYTSLKLSVWKPDGLKLSVTARGNPGTGRGAAEAFASYPLARPLGIGVYAFGQGFVGYGEALDDFRVHDTHLRLGIALTR